MFGIICSYDILYNRLECINYYSSEEEKQKGLSEVINDSRGAVCIFDSKESNCWEWNEEDLRKNCIDLLNENKKYVNNDVIVNIRIFDMIKKITINQKEKTVTVLLHDDTIGVAKCTDGDNFNIELGIYQAITNTQYNSKNSAHKKMAKLIENAEILN